MLRSPEPDRRQPLLQDVDYSSRGGARNSDRSDYRISTSSGFVRRRDRVAEVAGGATAECAAVACCCPCGLVELLVLAAYKVPAGLCKKALRKQRRRHRSAGLMQATRWWTCDVEGFQLRPVTDPETVADDSEVIQLEKEMWDRFYNTGFWRSASQRSDVVTVQ